MSPTPEKQVIHHLIVDDKDKVLVVDALRTICEFYFTPQEERLRLRKYISQLENSKGKVVEVSPQ